MAHAWFIPASTQGQQGGVTFNFTNVLERKGRISLYTWKTRLFSRVSREERQKIKYFFFVGELGEDMFLILFTRAILRSFQ